MIFQPDGVIGRRVTLDVAPLKASKQSVKQFDFDGLACDKTGRMLINDVIECKSEPAVSGDCLAGLTVKSLVSTVPLVK